MFFNCKRSISCFVVFFSFFKITAQELEEQKGDKLIVGLKKIVAGDQILSMPVFKKKHITLSSQNDDTNLLGQEVYNDRWDTVRFNPYWDTSVSFPFQLKFKDDARIEVSILIYR